MRIKLLELDVHPKYIKVTHNLSISWSGLLIRIWESYTLWIRIRPFLFGYSTVPMKYKYVLKYFKIFRARTRSLRFFELHR
jgi:hypothetical protein